MKTLQLHIRPLSAFATPPLGDTLFGQLCWILRHVHGEAQLEKWLEGYTTGAPFLVMSDFLPRGFVSRPTVPPGMLGFDVDDVEKRKAMKRQCWLPQAALEKPLSQWCDHLCEVPRSSTDPKKVEPWRLQSARMHNSLNRLTTTTSSGEAGFAPWQRQLLWFGRNVGLTCWLCFDDSRIDEDNLCEAIGFMGQQGFGKDASTGCGRFEVVGKEPWPVLQGTHRLTLSPVVPEQGSCDPAQSYCEPFTRFGRHGDSAVHGGNPFKNPVLMAQSHALLKPMQSPATPWLGTGLRGLSHRIAATVHQGYAPTIAVTL